VGVAVARPRERRLIGRWFTVGRLAARTAIRSAVHYARRFGASADKKAAADDAFALKSAEDVARTLGQMKGAFMKVGQLFSFVDDRLPENVRAALGQLQDSAPPMSPGLAAQVIRDEFGAGPDELFDRWDPTPIAAASIGQVHRAVLRDGTPVAVKVQYPGIAEIMEADLAQLELGRFIMPVAYPHMDVKAVTDELRDRLTEELDYRVEAANQRDFARWYRSHPFIHVPPVVDELSSRRVVTTGYADGARFAAFEQRSQADRDRAAEAIFRFVFRSLHDHLAFNGDPHPGNYLFGPDGAVTFIDFGLVKRFTAQDRDNTIAEVVAAALDPNPAELRRLTEEVGYFPPGNPLSDDVIFRFSSLLWSHLAEDRPMTLTAAWASDIVRTFLLKGPEFRELDRWGGLPPSTVILQRITVGVLAILGRLNATANWHRIARELWLGEPPASPMGELEAAWLATSP
jgi:predicted unusual protein kinase regulating ubiquinone biosynthesis (AarF/ABC1/UbiB family)